MEQVFFITPAYIKQYASNIISNDIDDNLIVPSILLAQDKYIQQILGENLYNWYKDGITNGTITTGDKKYLLDNYILPCLMYYTIKEALPFISFKLTNKAIVEKSDNSSRSAGVQNIKMLSQTVENSGIFYGKRIYEFISNVPGSFPEYYSQVGNNRIVPINPNQIDLFLSPKTGNGNWGGFSYGGDIPSDPCCPEGKGFYLM